MSFIRPELTAAATRWRESLGGGAAALAGVLLLATTGGAAFLIGLVLAVGGAALAIAGVQKARFRQGGGGAGVVSVDEGRLSYFGPIDGGLVPIAEMTSVDLVADRQGAAWVIGAAGSSPLSIPVDAEGADALFDVFETLPGIDTAAMLRAVEARAPGRVAIWARSTARLPAH